MGQIRQFEHMQQLAHQFYLYFLISLYMHIKQAYERRKQQEIKSHRQSHNSVDHTTVIGSIHVGHINYGKDEPFFVDCKVRDEVKEAREFVKSLKDRDHLQLKDKQWNSSVTAPRKFDDYQKEESHRSKLLKIKLGFSDFSPIKEKPNKIYPGTESRNDYTRWNVSTFFDKKQKAKGLQFTNTNAIDHTIKYNSSNLHNYKTLKQRYRQTEALNRSEITKDNDIIEDLKQSYIFTYPNSSPEKTNASVFRLYDQMRREKMIKALKDQKDTVDSVGGSRFKASLSPTQALKIKYVYFHTGNWEKSRLGSAKDSEDEEDGYYWTCCLKESKDSRGCSYRVEDGNKMNLSSFDHA